MRGTRERRIISMRSERDEFDGSSYGERGLEKCWQNVIRKERRLYVKEGDCES